MTDAVAEQTETSSFQVPILGDSPEGTDAWERTPYRAEDYGPVEDWATDFDHATPEYNPKAPEVW